jgi:hypothetical protein
MNITFEIYVGVSIFWTKVIEDIPLKLLRLRFNFGVEH